MQKKDEKMPDSDKKWQEKLTSEQYEVLRKKGTEKAFTGKYWDMKDDGDYHCAGCGAKLFSSDTKFDSGSGWPSFYDLTSNDAVKLKEDNSLFMHRTEVTCATCGGHLGHLFDDGPKPTGKRYCINSCALDFKAKKGENEA